MNYNIPELLSLSILASALLSVVRFRTTDPSYFPFLLLLWIGAANELISITCIHLNLHTTINNNIYVLSESLLILILFRQMGTTLHSKKAFYILCLAYIMVWVTENLIFGGITRPSSYFRIFYSFTTVLLSINSINYMVFRERRSLLREPLFLICICFISFFTYKILVESFWLYGLNNSREFRINVYTILVFLNLLVNLAFVLVVLWIPRKQEYTPLS